MDLHNATTKRHLNIDDADQKYFDFTILLLCNVIERQQLIFKTKKILC